MEPRHNGFDSRGWSEWARDRFPQTRYMGSKQNLLPFLLTHISGLKFHRALDAFSGSNCVAYALKRRAELSRLIAEAEADIDAGRVVPHEEIVKWLRSWGTPNELPCPFQSPGNAGRLDFLGAGRGDLRSPERER